MSDFLYVIISYFVMINLVGFISMGLDKRKARKHQWRIPEATLFTIDLLGGVIGSIIGMRLFRHKTMHMKCVVGMPVILVLWVAAACLIQFKA